MSAISPGSQYADLPFSHVGVDENSVVMINNCINHSDVDLLAPSKKIPEFANIIFKTDFVVRNRWILIAA